MPRRRLARRSAEQTLAALSKLKRRINRRAYLLYAGKPLVISILRLLSERDSPLATPFPFCTRKRTLSDVARLVLEIIERWNEGIADEKERSEKEAQLQGYVRPVSFERR